MGYASVQPILRASLPPSDPLLSLLHGGGPDGARLYPGGHFKSEAALARRLAFLDGPAPAGSLPRPTPAAVQALLAAGNGFAALTGAQERNLAAAGKPGTVFLLTGQQPGLLGGAVLWLYKAMTCAALAASLTKRLGRPVVPVFWVAGDDSDLQECNHLELLEALPEGLPSVLSLPFPEAGRPIPVGARTADPAAVEALLGRLARLWSPATLADIRAWRPAGGSLADAFLRLAHAWLAPHGVLFLDGHSAVVRAAARPVLERAVTGRRALEDALARGTAALEAAGFEAPVALRPGAVHAFAVNDGERKRLYAEATPAGDRLYLQDAPSAALRLENLALSHDVFTRLLIADAALPVLGHVLGPAELRYFAQAAPAFLENTGDMPLVHPRMSAAALPDSAAAAFAAAGFPLPEAAALKPSALRARLTERAWQAHPAAAEIPSAPPAEWLAPLRSAHLRHFRDTGPLERLERALAGSWSRYRRALERMAYAASPASADPAAPEGPGAPGGLFRHLRWLGNGLGQDRHLNLHSLVDALGRPGVEALLAAADPAEPGTRIFTYPDRAGRGTA